MYTSQITESNVIYRAPESLKKLFKGHDDLGFPIVNENYVGIMGFAGGKKNKIYPDKKLFTEDSSRRPLLFHFYDIAMQDHSEHEFLKEAILAEPTPEYRTVLKKGIFDILIPSIFLYEIDKIINNGLAKAYELKEENLSYSRGVNFLHLPS